MSMEIVPTPGAAAAASSAAAAAVQLKSTNPLLKWIGSLHSPVTSRRGSYLPLPDSVGNIRVKELQGLLVDVHRHTLDNIHICQMHLQFWRRKSQDVADVIGQEGPYFRHSEPFLLAIDPNESDITRVATWVLTNVRYRLANFLSKVYRAIEELRSESSLTILEKLNSYLLELNASVADVTRTIHVGTVNIENELVQLPAAKDVTVCISIVKSNLLLIDEKVSSVVFKFPKPRGNLKERWRFYLGAVTVPVISIWLLSYLRHNGAFRSFFESLFETIKDGTLITPMRTEVMESEHVQASKGYLKRMLLSFGETRHLTFPDLVDEAKADLILFEMFNEQLKSPLKSLMKGDILSALIIQGQMIKSLAVTRLEFYERIWAEGFRIVMFLALPAIILSAGVMGILWAWSSALRARSKMSKRTSRRLICEAQKRIEQYLRVSSEVANENDAKFLHGLVLYTLDHFYNYIEKEARAKEEWQSMREDIVAIGSVESEVEYKGLMHRILTYECLRFRNH